MNAKFFINGSEKSESFFDEGFCEVPVQFGNTEKKYDSFFDYAEENESFADVTPSTFSDGLVRFNPFTRDLLAVNGVYRFCEEHSCTWLLDVIASYWFGCRAFHEDEYVFCKLYVSGHEAWFAANVEKDEVSRTVAFQHIPFTDLELSDKPFCLSFNIEQSILIFSTDH